MLGGTLLVTPMLAADGEVYAVAQGSVATGGFSIKGQAQTVTKGVPTAGRVSSGAIVEREVGFELAKLRTMNLVSHGPAAAAMMVAAVAGGRPKDPWF